MALEHASRASQRTRTGHWPKAGQPIIPGPGNPPRGFVVTVRGRLCAFRGWLHTQSSRAISSSIIKLLIGTGEWGGRRGGSSSNVVMPHVPRVHRERRGRMKRPGTACGANRRKEHHQFFLSFFSSLLPANSWWMRLSVRPWIGLVVACFQLVGGEGAGWVKRGISAGVVQSCTVLVVGKEKSHYLLLLLRGGKKESWIITLSRRIWSRLPAGETEIKATGCAAEGPFFFLSHSFSLSLMFEMGDSRCWWGSEKWKGEEKEKNKRSPHRLCRERVGERKKTKKEDKIGSAHKCGSGALLSSFSAVFEPKQKIKKIKNLILFLL